MELEPDGVVTELAARQACPLEGVFAFLDPLLGRAALIVECDDPLGGSAQVGYNEPDARVQLTRMPLDQAHPVRGRRRRSEHLRLQRRLGGVHPSFRDRLRTQAHLSHRQLPFHRAHHRRRQRGDRAGAGADGGTGTGKTHLAVAIARSCIRKGARGRCYNVVDLVNHLDAELRAGRQGRTADQLVRRDLRHPRRTRLPALRPSRRGSCSSTS